MAMWNNQMVNPNLHRAEFVWKFIGFSTKNRWLIMISWHGESSIYGHLISNVSTELWSSSMLMGFSIIIHPAVVPPFMEVLNPYNDHFFLVVNYCGWLWNPSPADMWFIPLYIQYWINVVYRLPLIQGATTNYLQYIVDKYFFDMNITTTIFDRYEHTPMIWQPSTVSISIVGHPASRGPGLAATQNGPAGGAARPSGARLTSDEG